MNQRTDNESDKEHSMIIKIVAGMVILAGVLAGIGIYNTLGKRVSRHLDIGNRYLEEQNYELAELIFEEVISIDDKCVEAYMGEIKAYLHGDKADKLEEFYEYTLDMIESMDADEIETNLESVETV